MASGLGYDLAMRSTFVLVCLGLCSWACGDSSSTGGSNTGGDAQGGGGSGGQGSGGQPQGGAASGGAGGGSGGAAPGTPCEEICGFFAAMEEEVMCGYDSSPCIPDCEAGFNQLAAGCEDEAIAYNDCVAAQPTDAFNCTAGVFTLTNGECDDALATLTACM